MKNYGTRERKGCRGPDISTTKEGVEVVSEGGKKKRVTKKIPRSIINQKKVRKKGPRCWSDEEDKGGRQFDCKIRQSMKGGGGRKKKLARLKGRGTAVK